jgi:hypothetical protein
VYAPSLSDEILAWTGFADTESEVERFEVGIGSICGTGDIVSYRSVGLVMRWRLSEAGAVDVESPLQVGVRAWNVAGGFTLVCLTLVIDATAPVGGIINDGWSQYYSASAASLYGWDECSDSSCDMVGCEQYHSDPCVMTLGSAFVQCHGGTLRLCCDGLELSTQLSVVDNVAACGVV